MCPAKQIIQSESFLHNWLFAIVVRAVTVLSELKNAAERRLYYLEELFQQIKEKKLLVYEEPTTW